MSDSDPAYFHHPKMRGEDETSAPAPGPTEEELQAMADLEEFDDQGERREPERRPDGYAVTREVDMDGESSSQAAENHALEALAAARELAEKGGSLNKQAHLVAIAQVWASLSATRFQREAADAPPRAFRLSSGRTGSALTPLGVNR